MNDPTSPDSNRETNAGPFGTLGASANGAGELSAQASHVGTLLCATRMRLGKDLQDIAAVLHIRYNFLVAIEDGRYEDLPGQAYAIGFVRAYADHLGLDGDEVVRRYKEETAGVKRVTRYEYPMSAPESGIPSGALLLIAVVMGMMVYGVWYTMADADRRAADVIQEVPDRLAALLNSGPSATSEPEAMPEQVADASASPESESDFVPPVVEDEEAASAAPIAEVAPTAKPATPEPQPTQVAALPQPKAAPQPEPQAAAPVVAPAVVAPPVVPAPIKAPEKVAEKAPEKAPEKVVEKIPSPPPVAVAPPPVVTPPTATPPAVTPPAVTPTAVTPTAVTPTAVTPTPKPAATPPPAVAPTPKPTAPTQVASAPVAAPTTSAPVALPPKATVTIPPSQPATTVATAPAATAKPPSPTPAAPKPAAPAAQVVTAGKNAVELRAKSDSWIQVRDGEQLLLTRFLRKGETYKVPERAGLTLMTLNAGGIDIMVDGQLMPPLGDPGSVARGVALDAAKLKAMPKPAAAPANPG